MANRIVEQNKSARRSLILSHWLSYSSPDCDRGGGVDLDFGGTTPLTLLGGGGGGGDGGGLFSTDIRNPYINNLIISILIISTKKNLANILY